jgi:hypothetical protein
MLIHSGNAKMIGWASWQTDQMTGVDFFAA